MDAFSHSASTVLVTKASRAMGFGVHEVTLVSGVCVSFVSHVAWRGDPHEEGSPR